VVRKDISISTAKKLFPQLWENSEKTVGELRSKIKAGANAPGTADLVSLLVNVDPQTPAGKLGATSTATVSIANLWQTSDEEQIEKIVDEVLAANAKQVADYRAGKDKAFNSLVGQVMKASKGKANPAQVNEILRRRLAR